MTDRAQPWPGIRASIGVTLVVAYALPLFFPPKGVLLPVVGVDDTLWERLFPGVPGGWVGIRLVCLALGAFLLAGDRLKPPPQTMPAPARSAGRLWLQWLGFAVAVGLTAAALFAHHFSRPQQLLFIATLFVPALLASAATWPRQRIVAPRSLDGAIFVAVLWTLAQAATILHSPRSADPVDTWLAWDHMTAAAQPTSNLLTDGPLPGITYLHLLPLGAGVLGTETLQFPWVQGLQVLWLAVTAIGVGWLAAVWIGRAAVPIAAAVFLFSPFMLMPPLTPAAYAIGPGFTVAMLVAASGAVRRNSTAALVALGTAAGFASTHPWTLPAAAILLGAVALVRPRTLTASPLTTATAVLCFCAVVIPGAPRALDLQRMVSWYGDAAWQWTTLEAMLLGQAMHIAGDVANQIRTSGPLDILLGAVLAPFATPRSAIRLIGDSLFDPLATILAAIGIVVCLRNCSQRAAQLLLLLFLVAILPGALMSTYDRASLNRLALTPVPFALLAALGFESVRDTWRGDAKWLAGVATMTSIAGGLLLFWGINPTILPASWLHIAIEELQRSGARSAVVLYPQAHQRSFVWLQTAPIMSNVPRRSVATAPYDGPAALDALAHTSLILWSPAHELYAAVGDGVCAKWPRAEIYSLVDEARLSRLFVARTDTATAVVGATRVEDCAGFISRTAAMRARTREAAAMVIDLARDPVRTAGRVTAVELLRNAAFGGLADAPLFSALAEATLAEDDPAAAQEATLWAERACDLTGYRDPGAIELLARTQAAAGRRSLAIDTARLGAARAKENGDDETAERMAALARSFEREPD